MPDLIIKPENTSGNKVKIQDQGAVTRLQTEDAGITLDTATVTTAFTSPGIDDNANANAITIDSDEKVGIGETSPDNKLHVKYGDVGVASNTNCGLTVEGSPNEATEESGINILSTAGGNIFFGDAASAVVGRIKYDHADNKMQLYTDGTEKMTIDSDGKVGIGDTTPTPHFLKVEGSIQNDFAVRFDNTASQEAYVLYLKTTNVSQNNTSQAFVFGDDAEGAEFRIFSDGSFYQNSDRRTKENIEDVESMLEKVNTLKVKTYNRIGDVDKGHHIGLISQDVEEIFPHLVTTDEAKDAILDKDGNIKERATEERKALYKIGLVFPLIKAFQELSAKNDALEAKVTALENA